jgi:tetratricopeptide (TPR) repeat protein
MNNAVAIVWAAIAVAIPYSLRAGDPPAHLADSLAAGNAHYVKDNFKLAAAAYGWVLAQGYESAALYYNLGNAYYKGQNLPLSIWCYEKALLLRPNLEEARINLDLANGQLPDKVQALPRMSAWVLWQRMVNAMSPLGWALSTALACWLAAMGLAMLLLGRAARWRRWGLYLVLAAALALLGAGTLAYAQWAHRKNPRQAIVITSNVYVKSAPEAHATDLFLIHAGLNVHTDDQIGPWAKIRLADGKMGWVELTDIKPL